MQSTLHYLPTTDILFRNINSPPNPSEAHLFFFAELSADTITKKIPYQFAIGPHSGRRDKNSPMTPTLPPRYLHPPNNTMPLPDSFSSTTTIQHYTPPSITNTDSDNTWVNFDRDNPAL